LALYLSSLGHRTCLFDADQGLANLAILLDLYPKYTLKDVILYNQSIHDIIIRNYEGIDIIPGSSGVEKLANLDRTHIERLALSFSELKRYEFLIFDTSAGVTGNSIPFCLACKEVILVISSEAASLTDAFALIKILKANSYTGLIKVVVNHCKSVAVARYAFTRFRETVKKHFGVDLMPLGIITHDPRVEDAARQKRPWISLYPDSPAANCLKRIAKHLIEEKPQTLDAAAMKSFWGRSFELIATPLSSSTKKTKKQFENAAMQGWIPTPTHILLKLISACCQKRITPEEIYIIIAADPGLTVRVVALFSLLRRELFSQGIKLYDLTKFLKRDQIKAIAISAAKDSYALESSSGEALYILSNIWRHSLECAIIGEEIAARVFYADPAEAYLAGLLHDIGKFFLWADYREPYEKMLAASLLKPESLKEAEAAHGISHSKAGALLINKWRLSSFMEDAVRYHHEPIERIQGAFTLVQIVHAANVLCYMDSKNISQAEKDAGNLFGLGCSDIRRIVLNAREKATCVASSFGISCQPSTGADLALAAEKRKIEFDHLIRETALISTLFQHMVKLQGEEIGRAVIEGLQIVFNIHKAILFLYDKKKESLNAATKWNAQVLAIPLHLKGSLIVRTFLESKPLNLQSKNEEKEQTITDKQILRLLETEDMLVVPLNANGNAIGVLVVGGDKLTKACLQAQERLFMGFINEAALALSSDIKRNADITRMRGAFQDIEQSVAKAIG
ncbi:MAG: HDOD domain-containing protein, partial [Pseudomonadota bacterium]